MAGRCHRSTLLGTRCLFVLSALLVLFLSQTPLSSRSSTGRSSCTSRCVAASVGVVMADSSGGSATAGRIVKPYRHHDGDKQQQQHSISSASSSSSNEGILKSQEHFIRVQYCTS